MSEPVRAAADQLRDFLFDRVYEPLNRRPDTHRAQHLIRTMFAYFEADPNRIPASESAVIRSDAPARQAADFISPDDGPLRRRNVRSALRPPFLANLRSTLQGGHTMARDAVLEVRERTDMVELVGTYVQLKRTGRSFKGLCPFHQEKTPSFIVFPDSQKLPVLRLRQRRRLSSPSTWRSSTSISARR